MAKEARVSAPSSFGMCELAPRSQLNLNIIVLWKTLTLMAPTPGDDFKEDITAWARLFYFEENGEFKGRLEVCKELEAILAPSLVPNVEQSHVGQSVGD